LQSNTIADYKQETTMDKSQYHHNIGTYETSNEINWAEHYPRLHALAKRLVYKYRIPCWCGQEEDVADDVTQETARRLIERQQKAACGDATPIDLPEHMMVTIAHHYILDLVRHEHWVIHVPIEELIPMVRHREDNYMRMEEIAIENVSNEWFFLQLAHAIAQFPNKQRQAILIDLANRTYFDEQPTLLQIAFLTEGIDLQVYQQPLSTNPTERAQHAALLHCAYKRLTQLTCWRYDEVAA
jgi:DNA-directed RNA polymerase specialized sigma24 family protein